MDLSEHYDLSSWLPNGWHEVEIISSRVFKANTGTEGVEFTAKSDGNRSAKATFWLTEDAMKILGKFAKACGLSRDAARHYEHRNLVGLRVQVLIVQDGKYQKVDDWAPIGEQREDPPARPQQEQSAPSPPTGDGIPF